MYKEARALKNAGHRVTLCYAGKPLEEHYPSIDLSIFEKVIPITLPIAQLRQYESQATLNVFRYIWDLAENFDLLHCHNEPDIFSTIALASHRPVIHDTHDFLSFRGRNSKFFEAMATRGASGRIYVSQVELNGAKQLYGISDKNVVLLPNYMNRDLVPKVRLKKLSEESGIPHLVAPGKLSSTPDHVYFFLPGITYLVNKGIHVHLYPYRNQPIEPYKELARKSGFLHIHEQKPQVEFLQELTQYDIGFTPWHTPPEKRNDPKTHGHLSNRLMEMVGVGLPVISTNSYASAEFIRTHDAGCIVSNGDGLIKAIEKLMGTRITPKNVYMEDNIQQVISLYHTVLNHSS
ncbi:MAG: glycosyltransferase [bacterium]|jgi:glycosyltransferase involved in cell wall biosynthesis